MKAFYQFTDDEIAVLNEQQLQDSIRLEAIERGIKVPVGLPPEICNTERVGFRYPAEAQIAYCISEGGYSQPAYGYMTRERALAALEGVVKIGSRYVNGQNFPTIESCEPRIIEIAVGLTRSNDKLADFTPSDDGGSEAFDNLVKDCVEKCSKVRQDRYNAKVKATRKAEYLRLAGGDQTIAEAFWRRAGEGEWPV